MSVPIWLNLAQMLFAFVAQLFADAFAATRVLADKVVSVYSEQGAATNVSEIQNNVTADCGRPTSER